MTLALCAQGDSPFAPLDERMGRCAFFAVRKDDGEITFVPNEAKEDTGAGVKAARQLIALGVRELIAVNVGPKAYDVLVKGGIKVFKGQSGLSVEENIKLWLEGKLIQMQGPTKEG